MDAGHRDKTGADGGGDGGPGLFGAATRETRAAAPWYVRVAVERALHVSRGGGSRGGGDGAGGVGAGGAGADGLVYGWRLASVPEVGARVLVPLGGGKGGGKVESGKGALAAGVVVEVGGVEVCGGLALSRVRDVESEEGVVLPRELVELAGWLAKECYCSVGMALATMMPAAVKQGTGRRVVRMVTRTGATLPPRGTRAAAKGGDGGGGAGGVGESAEVVGRVSKVAREAFARIEALDAGEFPMPMVELARLAGLKGVGAIRALVRAGVLAEHDEDRVRARRSALDVDGRGEDAGASGGASGGARSSAPVLTDEQRACVEAIDADGSGEHLVFGVTGSGKTEVYLALIERVLARGRDAIVLVPEIALTPQTQGRFVARFGSSRVAVLHSGLTAAQRHEEWLRCLVGGSGGGRGARGDGGDAGGSGMVVVGARSAVFAPVGRLGLIVIDEEHDGSYKQDRSPRYLALDVARERVRRAGVGLVLGSATPALERWARATRTPRSRLHRLTVRATGAPMPRVVVVDMREERRRRQAGDAREAARVHVLGPTLERALETTLGEGGQAILLLNRRGFAHYVACPKAACGFILGCDSCDARLVLHKGRELPVGSVVKCHHCLAERLVPRVCPDCGGSLVVWGAGTQRAEEELSRKFASMGLVEGETLLRLDADTMGRASEYFAALERFGSGRARVLLGTQMIAKGLDFPGVRLVGVLDADTSMSLPDFRAAERTYQLVSQVAGRAGRVGTGGLVIVQTWTPEAAAIKHAATHDYVGFAEAEMLVRKRAGLPPFTRMARIVSRDERERVALERGRAAAEAVRAGAVARGVKVRVRGPVPCAIARIADRFRYGVEVVATSLADLHAALDHAWNAGALTNDEAMAIDVDPLSLG